MHLHIKKPGRLGSHILRILLFPHAGLLNYDIKNMCFIENRLFHPQSFRNDISHVTIGNEPLVKKSCISSMIAGGNLVSSCVPTINVIINVKLHRKNEPLVKKL